MLCSTANDIIDAGGEPMKQWALITGVILAAAGTLLIWQDIGSPNTGNIVQAVGILVIFYSLLRTCGG
jgi:hypothetical protein